MSKFWETFLNIFRYREDQQELPEGVDGVLGSVKPLLGKGITRDDAKALALAYSTSMREANRYAEREESSIHISKSDNPNRRAKASQSKADKEPIRKERVRSSHKTEERTIDD